MIDYEKFEKLIEYWKVPYSERYKHVKELIANEILPLYNNHINMMTSLIQASLFKMINATDEREVYEALSRLNGALKVLESLVDNLTNDVNKILTIVLAPKTVIPSS
jgi:hypothetical protein